MIVVLPAWARRLLCVRAIDPEDVRVQPTAAQMAGSLESRPLMGEDLGDVDFVEEREDFRPF